MASPAPSRPRRTAADRREVARNRLIESRLTPNAISMAGLVGNLVAAVLAYEEHWVLAGVTFLLGSICDTLDGRYSRMSGKGTAFGAFLDSTLDRMEEGVVLVAIGAHFARQGDDLGVMAVGLGILFSLMVSYTRARAEALGVECKVGLASRAIRVVILAIGLLFAEEELIGGVDLLPAAVYVLAVMAIVTTFQRIFHVRRVLTDAPAAL